MFIDKLLNAVYCHDTIEWPPDSKTIIDPNKVPMLNWLRNSEVFNINDVTRYLYEISAQEVWDPNKDFPNLAPPYPNMVFESYFPTTSNSNGIMRTVSDYNFDINYYLTLVHSDKISDVIPADIKIPADINWLCSITNFYDLGSHWFWSGYMMMYGVTLEGTTRMITPEGYIWASPIPSVAQRLKESSEAPLGAYYSSWLAISLLHCKNVTVRNFEHPVQLQRSRIKRNKLPLINFHTLNIQPMVKILNEEGEAENKGVKYALHICRGHFKDYSKGTGLFGRSKGLYWWDAQVRGKVEQGITLKDYKVSEPYKG